LRESGKLFNLCTRNLKLEFTSSDDPEDDWPSARFIFSLCVSLLSNLLSSAYECLLLPFPKSPSSLFYETELFDKDQPSHLSASFARSRPMYSLATSMTTFPSQLSGDVTQAARMKAPQNMT
jgi:hypothetical protein